MGVRRDKAGSSAWEVLASRCLTHRQVMISNEQLLYMSESHREMWTEKALEMSKDVWGCVEEEGKGVTGGILESNTT